MIDKKKIVIDNYFKVDCNIDTTIREAYRKGFERALQKLDARKINDDNMGEKNMKKNMPFRQAWLELLNGKKVRRSPWKGYWAWENNTIMMHCADGTVLDIRKTDNPAFTFTNIATDDWEVAEE